jgi:ABC-2 type transport system permease protein
MKNLRKLWAIIWKDILIIFGDTTLLALLLAMPLAISGIIGLAFGSGGGDVGLAGIGVIVVNNDAGTETPDGQTINFGQQLADFIIDPPSEQLERFFNGSQMDDWDAAREKVEAGEAAAAIYVPEDFSAQANVGDMEVSDDGLTFTLGQGVLDLYLDSGQPISGTVVESVVTGWANSIATGSITTKVGLENIMQEAGLLNMQGAVEELTGRLEDAYQARPISMQQQDAGGVVRQVNMMTVIGSSMALFFLNFNTTFGAGALLEERQNWTLQRVIATPTPRVMVLAGKLASTFLSGLIQMTLLLVATSLLGATWGSSIPALVLLVLAVVFAATGLGTLIASLVQRAEDLGGYGVGIMMVIGLVSGTFTSTQFLGDLKFLSMMTPNWWGIEAFGEISAGGGIAEISTHLLVLAAMGAVTFGIGVWRFGKQLDI